MSVNGVVELGDHFIGFKHPFSMLLVGSRGTGKTEFTKTLLARQNEFISHKIDHVYWFSGSEQKSFSQDMESVPSRVHFREGLPDENIIEYAKMRSGTRLIVIDDLMSEASKREDVLHLFTRGRHADISVIFLSQNGFHQGKHFREVNRNSDYIVYFQNTRDQTSISTVGSQMGVRSFLQKAFHDATKEAYTHFLIDYRADTPNMLRYRSKTFDETPIFYVQPEGKIV